MVTGVWSGDFEWSCLDSVSLLNSLFTLWTCSLDHLPCALCLYNDSSWNYYGERCFEFLFGVRFIWLYRVVFVLMVLLGGFIELDMVWIIADIVNALMALPNLIALLVLSPVVIAETKSILINNEITHRV